MATRPKSTDRPFSPAVLEALLGPRFAVDLAAPNLDDERSLFPDERQYIANAAPGRRAEFATVRACARRALASLGASPCSFVPNPDRSPSWPPGVTGSMSHTHGCCAAAVSLDLGVIGVGIDIEVDCSLPNELESAICTDYERAWLDQQPNAERGHLTRLIFSSKEAVYKCQYPVTTKVLAFNDVTLDLDLSLRRFSVKATADANAQLLARLNGNFARPTGFMVAAASLTTS